ncbi:DUF4202 domain-containing protein [Chloroflexi bacterium TSY]|nr:DUF4202 domain-containing protein [Chloroflexi bacterium TSY]
MIANVTGLSLEKVHGILQDNKILSERFYEAIARFDMENAKDPNIEQVEGQNIPKELLYARRMTDWLEKITPDAPEIVRLAARSQHIRRWTIPRSDYPMDKAGYKKWRSTLARFHADTAAEILREVGYAEETIRRVQSLLRKERLKLDPDVQLLEDVICLVFLENYFADFAQKHDEEKLIGIVRKTWKKMSERGREAALLLDLPDRAREVVEKALSVG